MLQPLGDRFYEKRQTLREIPWTIAVGDLWRSRCRSQPLAIGMFLCDPSSECQIASSLFLPHLDGLGRVMPRHCNGVSYLPVSDATTWRVSWHNRLYSPGGRAANCFRRSLAACKSPVVSIRMNIPSRCLLKTS